MTMFVVLVGVAGVCCWRLAGAVVLGSGLVCVCVFKKLVLLNVSVELRCVAAC